MGGEGLVLVRTYVTHGSVKGVVGTKSRKGTNKPNQTKKKEREKKMTMRSIPWGGEKVGVWT